MIGDHASSLAGSSLSNFGGKCDGLIKGLWNENIRFSAVPASRYGHCKGCLLLVCSASKTLSSFCEGWTGLNDRESSEICKFLKFGTSFFLSLLGEVPQQAGICLFSERLIISGGWTKQAIFSLRDVWWVFSLQILTFNIVHLKLVSTVWKMLQHKYKPLKNPKPLKINRLYSPQKHWLSETPAFNYC